MHQLLLLRHAKSSWDDPALSDHARPLNPRGRRAAAAMRKHMQLRGLAPDVILVSSSRRTLQTLEAVGPWPDSPLVEVLDVLYLADAGALLQQIQATRETVRSLLLVGHNPGLHDLALELADSDAASERSEAARRLAATYPSGALAEFTVTGSWSALGKAGAVRLAAFVRPEDLTA
jgi:phosphohistidine phosphatase